MPPKSAKKATAPAAAKASARKATAPAAAKAASSLTEKKQRLVHSAVLPASVERAILDMLPFRELGKLAHLCKSMRSVLVAHAELRHHIEWQNCLHIDRSTDLVAVGLAACCRQLRSVSLRDLAVEQELAALLPRLVSHNAESLRDVYVDALMTTPALLEALSRCPRLTHFYDVGSTGFDAGHQDKFDGYFTAMQTIRDRCLELRHFELDIPRDDHMPTLPRSFTKNLLRQGLPLLSLSCSLTSPDILPLLGKHTTLEQLSLRLPRDSDDEARTVLLQACVGPLGEALSCLSALRSLLLDMPHHPLQGTKPWRLPPSLTTLQAFTLALPAISAPGLLQLESELSGKDLDASLEACTQLTELHLPTNSGAASPAAVERLLRLTRLTSLSMAASLPGALFVAPAAGALTRLKGLSITVTDDTPARLVVPLMVANAATLEHCVVDVRVSHPKQSPPADEGKDGKEGKPAAVHMARLHMLALQIADDALNALECPLLESLNLQGRRVQLSSLRFLAACPVLQHVTLSAQSWLGDALLLDAMHAAGRTLQSLAVDTSPLVTVGLIRAVAGVDGGKETAKDGGAAPAPKISGDQKAEAAAATRSSAKAAASSRGDRKSVAEHKDSSGQNARCAPSLPVLDTFAIDGCSMTSQELTLELCSRFVEACPSLNTWQLGGASDELVGQLSEAFAHRNLTVLS